MADRAKFEAQSQIRSLIDSPETPPQTKRELEVVERNLIAQVPDTWIYRAVVVTLGSVVLLTVVGGIMLEFISTIAAPRTLPQAIVSIGSAAIGALAGLLAPSPASGK
ncbi:MAG: hypothetical protein P8P56_02845 [Yoonia sp.]|nr:hypothetical protein [Yoonia sp.]